MKWLPSSVTFQPVRQQKVSLGGSGSAFEDEVEDDAIVATDVEPLNCLEEALGEIVSPEKHVVNAFGLVRDMRQSHQIFWSSHHLMRCTPGVLFCIGIAPMG